jgi:hypothetical protein
MFLNKVVKWLTYWILYQAINIPLIILGLLILILPSVLGLTKVRLSKNSMFPGTVRVWSLEFLNPIWGNDENGVDNSRPDSSLLEAGVPRSRGYCYYWSALRNPTNNLRLLPGASSYSSNPVFKGWSRVYWAVDVDGKFCLNINGLKFGWLINWGATKGYRSWPVLL